MKGIKKSEVSERKKETKFIYVYIYAIYRNKKTEEKSEIGERKKQRKNKNVKNCMHAAGES